MTNKLPLDKPGTYEQCCLCDRDGYRLIQKGTLYGCACYKHVDMLNNLDTLQTKNVKRRRLTKLSPTGRHRIPLISKPDQVFTRQRDSWITKEGLKPLNDLNSVSLMALAKEILNANHARVPKAHQWITRLPETPDKQLYKPSELIVSRKHVNAKLEDIFKVLHERKCT